MSPARTKSSGTPSSAPAPVIRAATSRTDIRFATFTVVRTSRLAAKSSPTSSCRFRPSALVCASSSTTTRCWSRLPPSPRAQIARSGAGRPHAESSRPRRPRSDSRPKGGSPVGQTVWTKGPSVRATLALLVHPRLGPPLEAFHLLYRPLAVTRHRTVPQALENRRGVLLYLVVRRQVERPSHGLVVHRTEQRLDVLLEAHPFVSGRQQGLPRISLASKTFVFRSRNRLPEPGPAVPRIFSIVASELSRCPDMARPAGSSGDVLCVCSVRRG